MGKRTAGLLMFRAKADAFELLLVHPGGPFWKNKDTGAWSIPKGICEADEDLLATAQREFSEETGFGHAPPYIELGTVRQPSGTGLTVWAFEGDADPAGLVSNSLEMEWPPRSGKMAAFPEVDRAAWFGVDAARAKILKGQIQFVDAFAKRVVEDRGF